jgi:hypothetical protein
LEQHEALHIATVLGSECVTTTFRAAIEAPFTLLRPQKEDFARCEQVGGFASRDGYYNHIDILSTTWPAATALAVAKGWVW